MFNNLIGLTCTLAFNMNIYPASTFFLVTWGKKIKIKIIWTLECPRDCSIITNEVCSNFLYFSLKFEQGDLVIKFIWGLGLNWLWNTEIWFKQYQNEQVWP